MNKPVRFFVSEEVEGLRVGLRARPGQEPTSLSLSVEEAMLAFSAFALKLKLMGERLTKPEHGKFRLGFSARTVSAETETDGSIALDMDTDHLPSFRVKLSDDQAKLLRDKIDTYLEVAKNDRAMTRN